jgi:hypothetical protein
VDDVSVALEHVDLLDGLDGLDVELLEGSLKLLVVTSGPGGRTLDLSPGSSLAAIKIASVRISVLLGGEPRSRGFELRPVCTYPGEECLVSYQASQWGWVGEGPATYQCEQ